MEEWLVGAIKEKTGLDGERIQSLVNKKLAEFPELNEDAALRMIATENGMVPIRRKYKINDVVENLNHINVSGWIKRKQEARTVIIKGRVGKVMNLILEDDSGEIGIVVWNERHIGNLETAERGDALSVANAYSKMNRRIGGLELHLGSGSAIALTKNQEKSVAAPAEEATGGSRSMVYEIDKEDRTYSIRGFITRLFTNKIYLIRCEICKKTVPERCDIHGDKTLSKMLLITGVLDDGSGSVRISFFDKAARKLLDLSSKESIDDKLNDLTFGLYQVDISGRSNKFNDRLSITARTVDKSRYTL